eukprot:CAMPEP_0195510440 /NCGR_PEP_ID=MMETSP0794_2-20130614/3081_1 /TAXON_ID=515487 /ORGANISM="Stephanopyxis turris, Strain CCMP 815" /LENGTH=398 /DNA_ID=CAMNT_0040637859 /DNA_START=180 /DNA_END=1376 /DNA_ORIENTATION=-
MTSRIAFIDIIKAIKVFLNYNPNSYPIILSLENHCSIPYQKVMANILIDVLGDALFIPDESVLNGLLSSPESLRGRVVIKGRRPLNEAEDENDFDLSDTDDNSDAYDCEQLLPSPTDELNHVKVYVKIAPELGQLTSFHGTNFKTWDESISNPTYIMHSFSESQINRIFRQQQSESCIIYNKNHLSRTYPAGARVSSSNYNPVLAWSMGCQLVALNFQTPDAPLRINDGFFRQNGNCGYVRKSRQLLDNTFHGQRDNLPVTLTIRILSGSCLPKPKGQKRGECIDPYVKVAMYDVDERGKESNLLRTTIPVKDNGFSPIWNQEDFKFLIQNESGAMLLLTVWDKDVGSKDDFIASAAIPISCLRKGYRSVQLFDANNTRSGPFDFASILIKVDMEVIV